MEAMSAAVAVITAREDGIQAAPESRRGAGGAWCMGHSTTEGWGFMLRHTVGCGGD